MAILLSLVILPGFFVASFVAGEGGSEEESMAASTRFVTLGFVDKDETRLSGGFREKLIGSKLFGEIHDMPDLDSALTHLNAGRAAAVVLVPDGFERDVLSAGKASVFLYADESKPYLADTVGFYLTSVLSDFSAEVLPRATSSNSQALLGVVNRSPPYQHLSIGLGIILGFVQIFACFFEVAGSLSRERESGTLQRLALTGMGFPSIMLGATIYSEILAFIRSLSVLALAMFGYGIVVYGDISMVVLVSLLVGALSIGLALIVAILKASGRTVVITELFLIILLFAFSGIIRDRELMTGIPLAISRLLPWSYGFSALRKLVILGQGLSLIGFDLSVLLASTFAFYVLAYILYSMRRENLLS